MASETECSFPFQAHTTGPHRCIMQPTHVRFPYWTPNPSQRLWPRRGRSPRHAHIAELKHDDGLAEATSSQPPPAARSHLPHLHARLPAGRRVRTKRRLAERRRLGARQARTELLERHRRRRDAWAGMRFDVISMCMCMCDMDMCVGGEIRGSERGEPEEPPHPIPCMSAAARHQCYTAALLDRRGVLAEARFASHACHDTTIVEELPYYLLLATCY